jgi:hypothetical protein
MIKIGTFMIKFFYSQNVKIILEYYIVGKRCRLEFFEGELIQFLIKKTFVEFTLE